MSTPENPHNSNVTKLPSDSGRDAAGTLIEQESSTQPAFEPLITRRRAIAIGIGALISGTAAAYVLLEDNGKNTPDTPNGTKSPFPTEKPTKSTDSTSTPDSTSERIPGFLYPGEAFYRIEHPQKRVAITIDDCNDDEVIQEYLDLADEFRAQDYPVSFTFFPTGLSAYAYSDMLKKILANGHELGTHTYDHPFLTRLQGKSTDPEKQSRQRARLIREEILKGLEEIHDNVDPNYQVRFFRAPFGDGAEFGSPIDPDIEKACQELGLIVAGWSNDSHDTSPGTFDARNENKAAQRMISNIGKIKQGDIILFHANWPNSVDGVRKLLENLMAGGKIKADRTLSEMVQFGDSIPTSGTIYQSKTL